MLAIIHTMLAEVSTTEIVVGISALGNLGFWMRLERRLTRLETRMQFLMARKQKIEDEE